jgi:hypothetical protein
VRFYRTDFAAGEVTAAFGLTSLLNARELAAGSGLARSSCAYVAGFWGIRVELQAVFDVTEHLTAW